MASLKFFIVKCIFPLSQSLCNTTVGINVAPEICRSLQWQQVQDMDLYPEDSGCWLSASCTEPLSHFSVCNVLPLICKSQCCCWVKGQIWFILGWLLLARVVMEGPPASKAGFWGHWCAKSPTLVVPQDHLLGLVPRGAVRSCGFSDTLFAQSAVLGCVCGWCFCGFSLSRREMNKNI